MSLRRLDPPLCTHQKLTVTQIPYVCLEEGREDRSTFQLLILSPNLPKTPNTLCQVGGGGGEVNFPTFDAESKYV